MATIDPTKPRLEVYSYGGCTTCGNSMWNWLNQQGINIDHKNVQVTYVYNEGRDRAMALGVPLREVSFPLMFIGGKVFVGFKPTLLLEIINKVREELTR